VRHADDEVIKSSCLTESYTVRLGNSGLKVSKIILGCMSYGSKDWAPWVLDEAEGIRHIKAAQVSILLLG